jgi:hypothetical protein
MVTKWYFKESESLEKQELNNCPKVEHIPLSPS